MRVCVFVLDLCLCFSDPTEVLIISTFSISENWLRNHMRTLVPGDSEGQNLWGVCACVCVRGSETPL